MILGRKSSRSIFRNARGSHMGRQQVYRCDGARSLGRTPEKVGVPIITTSDNNVDFIRRTSRHLLAGSVVTRDQQARRSED